MKTYTVVASSTKPPVATLLTAEHLESTGVVKIEKNSGSPTREIRREEGVEMTVVAEVHQPRTVEETVKEEEEEVRGPPSKRRCTLIESLAGVDGQRSEEDDSDDDDQGSLVGFLIPDDECEGNDSSSYYRVVDGLREGRGIEPYFPLAFAKSPEEPLIFNFEGFFLDNLKLPFPINGSPADGPVTFDNSSGAAEDIRREVATWLAARPTSIGGETDRQGGAPLCKEQLFAHEGTALRDVLISGDPRFDANLERVRLDRFGNVAIFGLPPWSEACVQFVQGFPRKLCAHTPHGGFLPGNVIAASNATNTIIRRFAVKDVASCITRHVVQGAGLSLARLLNCRFAAVKCRTKSRSPPTFVLRAEAEFGVDFSTFEPLNSADLLERANTFCPPAMDDEDLTSVEVEDDDEEGQDEGDGIARLRSAILAGPLNMSLPPSGSGAEADEETPCLHRNEGVSSSSTGTGDSNRAHGVPEVAAVLVQQQTDRQGQETGGVQPEIWALPRPLPKGFRQDALPTAESIAALRSYMAAYRPISRTAQFSNAVDDPSTTWHHVGRASERELWEVVKPTCTCKAVQGGPDPACPVGCRQGQHCRPCEALRQLNALRVPALCSSAAEAKNTRLAVLLKLSPLAWMLFCLAKHLSQSKEAQKKVLNLFKNILHSSLSKVYTLINLGSLMCSIPRLADIQLSGGWSLFWTEFRKIAVALKKQPNPEARWAALLAIRQAVEHGDGAAHQNWMEYLEAP